MPLATLEISLVARLAELQSGMDKATRLSQKAAADIAGSFSKLSSLASSLGIGIASAFSIDAIRTFVVSTIDAIDAMNDVADATGASVENISALDDVARRTGTTLDNAASILVKFNNGLKSADGKNGVSQALKAIGVNADELKRLDPAEALRQVAVALSGFADGGNKARIIQELFGKSIKDAAPFLKDLSEQTQLNGTVTRQAAEQAERFNKAIYSLQANTNALARGILADALPALDKFIQMLVKYQSLSTGQKFSFLSGGAGSLSTIFTASGAQDALPGAQASLAEEMEAAKRLAAGGGVNAEALKIAQKRVADAQSLVNFYKSLVVINNSGTGQDDPAELARRGRGVATAPGLPDIATLTAKTPRDTTEEFNRSLDAIEQSFKNRVDDWASKSEEMLDKFDQRDLIGDAEENFQQRIRDWSDRNQEALDKIDQEAIDKIKADTLRAQGEIQSALGDTLVLSLKGDFDSIGQLWENLILKMITDAAAAQLNKYLFGSDGSSGQIGGFIAGLFASANGNAFGPGGVIPFANGGVVNGATMFGFAGGRTGVMGEAGPEAVMPLKRGRDGKLGVVGGGNTTVINVSPGPSKAEVLTAIQQAYGAANAYTDQRFRRLGLQ